MTGGTPPQEEHYHDRRNTTMTGGTLPQEEHYHRRNTTTGGTLPQGNTTMTGGTPSIRILCI
jgi:hypothetical protein